MKKKDGLKLVGATGLCGLVMVASLFLGLLLSTTYGMVMSLLLGFVLICLIIVFGYPVWFKDYIEEFWRKEEEKNAEIEEE